MASLTYRQHYSDGTSKIVRRSARQGRKPSGLVLWTGRIDKETMGAIKAYVAPLEPYHTVNSIIREALWKYVHTELLNT